MKRVTVSMDEDPFMKAFASSKPAAAVTTPVISSPLQPVKQAVTAPITSPPVAAPVSAIFSAPSPSRTLLNGDPEEINFELDRERRRREREAASSRTGLQSAVFAQSPSSASTTSILSVIPPEMQRFFASSSQTTLPDLPPPQNPVLPYQDYTQVDDQMMLDYLDDWDSHGEVAGETPVMEIANVFYYRDLDSVLSQLARTQPTAGQPIPSTQAQRDLLAMININAAYQLANEDKSTVLGKLYMTSYQLYLEPVMDRKERSSKAVIDGLIAVPLGSIERVEVDKPRGRMHILECHCKDGRLMRFGFFEMEQCRRAYDCLMSYVFPPKPQYAFAFYYKPKVPLPLHLNGWNLYNPVAEYKRLGIPNHAIRLSKANVKYQLSTSYPALIAVPSEKYFTDADLVSVATFRSRGRAPACTWQHPHGRQTIWRCSQPCVGMNNARCAEDEKMLYAISVATGVRDISIFDCRPKMNAQANRLAGKGFESPENYRNCKLLFMDIENIHSMRTAHQILFKACQADAHGAPFQQAVAQSKWLSHIAQVLKATFQMVLAIDRDKVSVLSHCSDGWDRTSQLVALTQLCLDPYYRTIEGFCVLIEKDWLSFGHQFARRNGHLDNKYTDTQRSPIFLQWLDCVYQLTQQFPRHFEFNSHFLVTLQHHVYSCRFGTFFFNNEIMRKKHVMAQQTVSVWSYFMCSPSACRGEFSNPMYAPSGDGSGVPLADLGLFKTHNQVTPLLNKRHQEAMAALTTNSPLAKSSSSPLTNAHTSSPASNSTSSLTSPIAARKKISEADLPLPKSASSLSDPSVIVEPRKSSFGRGGGDGSLKEWRGVVLYPSWSLKKLVLWSDYFLRYHSDQAEHATLQGAIGAGSVPPGGASVAQFTSNEASFSAKIRERAQVVCELDDTVRALKQKLCDASISSDISINQSIYKPRIAARPSQPDYDPARWQNPLLDEDMDLSGVQESYEPDDDAP